MKNLRRHHTADFKAKVAIEALKEQKTVSQISEQFTLHATQISDWKKVLVDGCSSLFEKHKPTTPADLQLQEAPYLEQIGLLQMELSFLKKKLKQLQKA